MRVEEPVQAVDTDEPANKLTLEQELRFVEVQFASMLTERLPHQSRTRAEQLSNLRNRLDELEQRLQTLTPHLRP